jgi:glycerol-3-phosphate acyltransferase PlsY
VGLSMLIYDFFSHRLNFELILLLFLFLLIYVHRSNLRNFFLGIEPKIIDKHLLIDRIPPKKDKFKM